MRGFDWSRLIHSLKWFLISLPLVFLFHNLAGYNSRLDRYSSYIKHNKPVAAKVELDSLRNSWRFADKFMFGWLYKNRIYYEAAYAYRVGGFRNVESILEGKEEWLAHRILGSANFRVARSLYRAGKRGEDLDFLLDQSVYHFEQSLRRGPYNPNFSAQWNYDLASAARIYSRVRRKALGEKPEITQIPFGFGDGEGEGGLPNLFFKGSDDEGLGRSLPNNSAGRSSGRRRRY